MVEFLLTFFVFLAVVVIMAVGVLRGRPPISGSCGGLNALGVDGA
ncbi:MAG: (Na+)-NQR maturation NqrM, partial [Pseudomonadales bacterium]